jgi:hypothetical protein
VNATGFNGRAGCSSACLGRKGHGSPWQKSVCIRRPLHPASRRGSTLKYSRYSRVSRLAIGRTSASVRRRTLGQDDRCVEWLEPMGRSRSIRGPEWLFERKFVASAWPHSRARVRLLSARCRNISPAIARNDREPAGEDDPRRRSHLGRG